MLSVGMNPLKRYVCTSTVQQLLLFFSVFFLDGWVDVVFVKKDGSVWKYPFLLKPSDHMVIIKTFCNIEVLFPPFCHHYSNFPGGGGVCNLFIQNQLIFNMRLYIDDLHFKFCINWPTFSSAFILCNLRLALINLVLTYTHHLFNKIPVSFFSFFECSIIIIII